MKNFAAILFLLSFGLSSQGGWIMNFINQCCMQKKVEANRDSGEDEQEVTRFVFTTQNFAKLILEDGGNELSMHGEMYDIISIEKVEDTVVIRCFADKRETQYKLLAKHHQSHKKSRVKPVLQKLYASSRPGEYNAGHFMGITKYFSSENNTLPAPLLDILKPPPDYHC